MALSRYHGAASVPLSVQQITEEAQKFSYTDERPLISWLRSASMLLSEASACEAEGDIQMAYLYTYRHAELVLSKLPHHPDARNIKLKDAVSQARKQVNANFAKLEAWKPRINSDYERYRAQLQRKHAAREAVEQQKRADEAIRRASLGSENDYEQDHRRSLDASEQQQLAIEIARNELSRREALHQQAGPEQTRSRVASDVQAVGRMLEQTDARRSDHDRKRPHTNFSYPTVPIKERQMDWTASAQPRGPILAPKASHEGPALPSKLPADTPKYSFRAKAVTEAGSPLRSVMLPSELSETFLRLARPNTNRNLETCGVLCATTISNALFINHLVIPDQNSTSDTCDATEDGDIALFDFCDKENLLVCGWIHTHPSQTCFLSSRDLHTSSGYQQMLPEAIAIVCAPQHSPSRGIFRLTDPPGLPAVLKCTQKGLFHPHAEINLYTDANAAGAGHVLEGPQLAFKVVDLRKS